MVKYAILVPVVVIFCVLVIIGLLIYFFKNKNSTSSNSIENWPTPSSPPRHIKTSSWSPSPVYKSTVEEIIPNT